MTSPGSPSAAHPDGKADGLIASKMNQVISEDVTKSLTESPKGKSPSLWKQALRFVLFVLWFNIPSIVIVATQLIGLPLALYDKNLFYAYVPVPSYTDVRYIANTKKSFGVAATTMTQWFAPTPIIISGDDSVKDEIKATPEGLVETHFSERLVFIANHLVYLALNLTDHRSILTGSTSGLTGHEMY
jgi:hypothetical protein